MAKLLTRKYPSGRSPSAYRPIPHLNITSFKYGLQSFPEPQQVLRGGAADELNFLHKGTRVETRQGYTVLGNKTKTAGNVSGIFTAHKWDGTEVIFKANGKQLFYLNVATWTEVGTNLLNGAGVEDISFAEYASPAGSQLWVSSPNSGLFKIMTANPGSAVSMYSSAKNFKGRITIKYNRMFAWYYLGSTVTNANAKQTNNTLQLSKIDTQTYTTTTDEVVGTGDGTTKTFTATLAAVTGFKTCFGIAQGTGNPETWTDNYLGVLTGSLGGTGTINYATGALSLTFNSAPANLLFIKMTYSTEDSTVGGIADFTRSATRVSGEGAQFPQFDGGNIQTVLTYDTDEYCLHERGAYILHLATDDTTATNLPYRTNISLPNWRAAVATQTGIYYIDTTISSKPYVGHLSYGVYSGQVEPTDLSSNILDLSGFKFDNCKAIEWDKYIVFSCRTYDSAKNNRMVLYNKDLKIFDMVDFWGYDMCIFGGNLTTGDPVTIDVYTLFTGFDDDGSLPNYYWTGNIDDLGINNLKKIKRLWIEGLIGPNQSVDVYFSQDRAPFVKAGTLSGSGGYVDKGQAVSIGDLLVGQFVVGGSGLKVTAGAEAYHFITQIKLKMDKVKFIQIKFVPTNIGYFSISMLTYFDIRVKPDKLPNKYR